MAGEDRIAICSAEPNEIDANPAASYNLLDGVGRCLPLMILMDEQKLHRPVVEAFLAKSPVCMRVPGERGPGLKDGRV